MRFLFFLLFMLVTNTVFSQRSSLADTVKKYRNTKAPVILAKDAYKYIGKMVIVGDSLYDYQIMNDSTVACHMGEKINTPRLTLIFIDTYNKNQGYQFFYSFKRYRLYIYGTITGAKDAPQITVRGGGNIEIEDRSPGHGAHGTEH